MSNACFRLGGLILAVLLFSGAGAAQVVGSQAANVTFAGQWDVPASPPNINELNDYFSPTASPGYVTLVIMWGIN